MFSQTEKVLRTLKQYIRIEQKDRQHIANRYHHLLQTDPERLASEKHTLADRVRSISLDMQQAVDLLYQMTHDERKLRNEIGRTTFFSQPFQLHYFSQFSHRLTNPCHLVRRQHTEPLVLS